MFRMSNKRTQGSRLRILKLRYFSPEGTRANSPGASAPGKRLQTDLVAPEGRRAAGVQSPVAPPGLTIQFEPCFHELKPVANRPCPFGTENAQLQNLRVGLEWVRHFLLLALVVALTAGPCWASAPDATTRLDDWSTKEMIAEIVSRADNGESADELVHTVEQRGGEAIVEATRQLDRKKPERSTVLYDVIAHAGVQRRMPEELLRLYDPLAWQMFYGDDAIERQRSIGVGLNWDKWPMFLPAAAVRAAPLPTLDWLATQANHQSPRVEDTIQILNEWSRWITTRDERQHVASFHRALLSLAGNQRMTDSSAPTIALLNAAAASQATRMVGFSVTCLGREEQPIRRAAAMALGRLPVEASILALVAHIDTETDSEVLADMAAALGSFSNDERASQAAAQLFSSVTEPFVRRQILFSAIPSLWSSRQSILQSALASEQGSVVAVALTGVDQESSAATAERVLALAAVYDEGPPALIDALGRVRSPAGVPHLQRWAESQKNPAVRLKIVLALEQIGNAAAQQVIANLVESEVNEDVLSWAIRAAGRLTTRESLETIAAIAEETQFTPSVRSEAIWALSYFDDERSRQTLRRLAADPGSYFTSTASGDDNELLSQARLYVELALLRLGEKGAEEIVSRLYRDGTPATRMTSLVVLGELDRDHAVIGAALDSIDFAVMLAAVRAAGRVDPVKYRPQLLLLRDSPFVRELLQTGLQDVETLRVFLDEAIQAGEDSQ